MTTPLDASWDFVAWLEMAVQRNRTQPDSQLTSVEKRFLDELREVIQRSGPASMDYSPGGMHLRMKDGSVVPFVRADAHTNLSENYGDMVPMGRKGPMEFGSMGVTNGMAGGLPNGFAVSVTDINEKK